MAAFEVYGDQLKLAVEGDSLAPDGSDLYMRALRLLISEASPDMWQDEDAQESFYAQSLLALAQHWQAYHRGRSYKSPRHCLEEMIQQLADGGHL